MKIRYLRPGVISIPLLLSGCATTLSGSMSTEIDPDYPISKEMVVVVRPAQIPGEDEMATKYYLDGVVDALRGIGFSNVYTQRTLPPTVSTIDEYVAVSFESKGGSFQYTAPDLGLVDSGRSATNCIGGDTYINCRTSKDKTIGVTGYSQRTGYYTLYYFVMYWFDARSRQRAMFNFAEASNDNCSQEANYRFLIQEGVKAITFDRPSKSDFKTPPPKDSCK